MPDVWLSIITPCLNEAARLPGLLRSLQPLRSKGAELIVVDGGSADDSPEIASALADQVISSAPGRGLQQHCGAVAARGRWLWFVHADTGLEPSILDFARSLEHRPPGWGFFPVRLHGPHPLLGVVAWSMNLRSRVTRVATGDQCLFVHRHLYDAVGGFPPLVLMEDVALSKRLRLRMAPWLAPAPVNASPRRWLERGVVRTVVLMWGLRLAYVLGVPPPTLRRWYYGGATRARDVCLAALRR